MKKKLVSAAALLLVPIILIVSLCSCHYEGIAGLTEKNKALTLPEDLYFNHFGKIPYHADQPNANDSNQTKSLMSVVSIYAYTSGVASAGGSGVIYQTNKNEGDAYIITNHHVAYDGYDGIFENIYVYLYGLENENYEIKAEYIGGSMQYDLAVLKITNSDILRNSFAQEAEFANSDEVQILDPVVAVGNAQGEGISATAGTINVDSEYLTMITVDNSMRVNYRVMRTDAAINPGNSGGGLFNSRGELVGIVNAKVQSSSVDNMGYVIPSNVARAVADNIIYFCDGTPLKTVYKCTLGIHVKTDEVKVNYDDKTGIITKQEVVKISEIESRAEYLSSVIRVGDTVKSITIDGNRIEITKRYQVVEAMLDVRDGSLIVVECIRDSDIFSIEIGVTCDMIYQYK